MAVWTVYLLALAGSYFVGGIPFALLLGKLAGADIRKHGSGNIGATNVYRTCGKGWGILCLCLDMAKGFIPVYVARKFLADLGELAPVLAVLGAVCGHVFCPYLKFKGGKGVATSAGAVLALAWLPMVIAAATWGVVLAGTRYVSLASICAAIALPLGGLVANRWHSPPGGPTLILLAVLGIVVVARHHSNIARLRRGAEPKIGDKRETP